MRRVSGSIVDEYIARVGGERRETGIKTGRKRKRIRQRIVTNAWYGATTATATASASASTSASASAINHQSLFYEYSELATKITSVAEDRSAFPSFLRPYGRRFKLALCKFTCEILFFRSRNRVLSARECVSAYDFQ